MLTHGDLEAALDVFNQHLRTGKRVNNGCIQGCRISNFSYCLEGCCEIRAIVTQDRRVGSDLRQTWWGLNVRPEMIVEAPRTNLFSQGKHLGSISRVGELGHHAVEAR